MVREENVKLMSKIAIYERRKGRTEIPINKYYKGDYVRLNSLKAVVSATVAFLLVVALIAVYKLDYILANVLKIDYKTVGIKILVIYGIWILLYWLIARIAYARRYESTRSDIIIYNHNLKKLRHVMGKEIVKTKGGVVIGDDFIDF
ncbi:MAG: hypothetical protein NC300_12730 [Bacteroidales bacterium]|nr:hypothetical protein [Clostridium sp.]MCM1205000.1 hypothetical protein [Bacteroidales bacterium]